MITTLSILKACTQPGVTCGWPELVELISELIKFGLYIAVTAAVFTIAWAGFKMMLNADNAGGLKAAKETLWNAVLGIVFVLGAYVIVQFILTNLGLPASYSLLK